MQFNFADVPADKRSQEGLGRYIFDAVSAYYEERESKNGPEPMRRIESIILLQTLDGL